MPGAAGQQAGLAYSDSSGVSYATYPLAPDYQGCSHPDPDHSYGGGRVEYNAGACDGWWRDNDVYAIGYYTPADLPFHAAAAQHWLSCDGDLAAILAPTYPNRLYQHAGQTDRIDDSHQISALPTIWDRLAASGLRGRYYYTDTPVTALWGTKYRAITAHVTQFLAACRAGTLPHVAYVDPKFINNTAGTSWDDHPHADIRHGQAFLATIYNAVVSSPAWPHTILVINYDEWGGFREGRLWKAGARLQTG